jgi:SSS family solute:Na+ symporter
MIAAAVLTTFSAVLNATITLYSVDFHRKFINPTANAVMLNRVVGIGASVIAIALVPLYAGASSIINLLQELNGLSSMPILSAFIAGLLFRNVDARAAIVGLVYGVAIYALHNFVLYRADTLYSGETFYQHFGIGWLHYIDVMVIVLVTSVMMSLAVNRIIFGNRATFIFSKEGRAARAAAA